VVSWSVILVEPLILMSAEEAGGRGIEALGKAGAAADGAGCPTSGVGSS